jgi:hypothetical protein
MIRVVSGQARDIQVKGDFLFPSRGAVGRAWLTIGAESVSVTKRGNPMARLHHEFTFAYGEIEGAQAARYLLDRGVKVHLRDGSYWYLLTSWHWSRSARAAVLDALRVRGVPIMDGVAPVPYFENTEAGIKRAASKWEATQRRDK